MTVWIQLWLPIFAIIKLYTFLTMNGEMAAMQVHGLTPNSIEWAWAYQQMVQHWLGISGWLSAATPTIALSLVYGGAITANSIAGNMQRVAQQAAAQSAHTFTPGLMTVGPSGVTVGDTTMQPQMTASGYQMGLGIQGTSNAAASPLQFELSQSNQVREARAVAESTMQARASQFVESFGNNTTAQRSVGSSYGLSTGITGQETTTKEWAVNAAKEFAKENNLTLSDKAVTSTAGGFGVSLPFGIMNARQQLASELSNSTGMSVKDADKVAQQFLDRHSASLTTAAKEDNGFTRGNIFQIANSASATENDSSLAQNIKAFQKSEESALTFSQNLRMPIEVQASHLD